jgi:hypothetical protein
MKNIDIEIYLNQLMSFFEKNPNDLSQLIGNELKEIFYQKIKEQCYKNLEIGEEISLTQQQLIDIIVFIKNNTIDHEIIKGSIQKTKFGNIFLN